MTNRLQKLQHAVKELGKYYGLSTVGDFARFQAFLEPIGTGLQRQQEERINTTGTPAEIDNEIVKKLLEIFLDTADGSLSTPNLCRELKTLLEGNDENISTIREMFQTIFYIAYDSDAAAALNNDRKKIHTNEPDLERQNSRPIRSMLGNIASSINLNRETPSKEQPAISIILSNTKRIALSQKFANACTIFLNGIPNLEILKAVPYLNIEFHFPGAPFSENGQLQSPGLLKFLVGAQQKSLSAINDPFEIMASANKTTVRAANLGDNGETVISDQQYSIGGMEMFTAPQTLVNADEQDQPNIRSNQILDKFRPFATIKQFEVNIAPSTGINSFKTAKLEFVLHDRSRLSEIANFIRPDLYGRNEMVIEYGWSHPDGENNTENLYGDLINGMRIKETYGISNASYTMDEAGQIQVTLQLFTKGSSDFGTEIISTDDDNGVSNRIQQIRQLEETIGEIRQRVWPQDGNTREVRGVQSLDVAQDALANILLSKNARKKLNDLQRSLAQSGVRGSAPSSTALTQLRTALEQLFGNRGAQNNANGDSLVEQLKNDIISQIKQKINSLNTSSDPFIVEGYLPPNSTNSRNLQANLNPAERQNLNRAGGNPFAAVYGDIQEGRRVSLAKLLLHFIAVPLASTKKFEDVQLVFYPFNSYAGFASQINIAEFEVDLRYFAQELFRYRLDNLGRTSGMNLRDFISFIAQTIIDDPAARSYGMFDTQGALYRAVFDDEGRPIDPVIVGEVPAHQERVENLLRSITPDGSFRMPKIDFYIECLPEKQPRDETQTTINGKNILKIHIFDAQSTTYDTVGALYASARNNSIQSVGTMPNTTTPVSEDNNRTATAYLAKAERAGLLEIISENPSTYRITGGSRKLKEFIMKTMPYIIYGAGGTLVKIANLSSLQNPELATVNMMRSFRRSELQPNGELPGGLPMRIIPAELQLSTVGCPLISYAQQFFVDFQTGTTVDNIYAVVGISHRITDGEFTTDIRLVSPSDAYGVYESFSNQVHTAIETIKRIEERSGNPQSNQGNV